MMPGEHKIALQEFSPTLRACLLDVRNYPEHPASVEEIETHFALVFLTESHAYKVKKPILWYDMDFRDVAARRFHCEEEVRLNRQLAPAIYLGVDTIGCDSSGHLRWNDSDAVMEYVVAMRRLPAEQMLDVVLNHRPITPPERHALVRMILQFHESASVFAVAGDDYLVHLRRYVDAHHELLARRRYGLPAELLGALRVLQLRVLNRRDAAFRRRAEGGFIRECHGDLRPEHICLAEPPCAIDRLEFSRSLRTMDVIEEWALLCFECIRLGHTEFADTLAGAALGGGEPGAEVWPFYLSKRALAKAKLCIWHLDDPDYAKRYPWPELAERCLELGLSALEHN
jgi:aminoglycoside phosphotransferase family enzyme